MRRSDPDRASDPGLAGERTSLAWLRLGLALLGVPIAMVAYYTQGSALAVSAAAVAAVLGLGILVSSVRTQRVAPGSLVEGSIRPPVGRVALTGTCVLLLAVAAAALVIG
jgi:uncharacterized membrane protein YidH (DUF202 family)